MSRYAESAKLCAIELREGWEAEILDRRKALQQLEHHGLDEAKLVVAASIAALQDCIRDLLTMFPEAKPEQERKVG